MITFKFIVPAFPYPTPPSHPTVVIPDGAAVLRSCCLHLSCRAPTQNDLQESNIHFPSISALGFLFILYFRNIGLIDFTWGCGLVGRCSSSSLVNSPILHFYHTEAK